MDDRYIEIPDWDRFQHYKRRDPLWVKTYTRLLSDEAYLGLTGHQRAVLHGLWLAYASSGRQLALNTASLSRRLALRVSLRQLEALNHAGFIKFSASKPLAHYKSLEVEVEVEKEKYIAATPLSTSDNGDKPAPKKERKPRERDPVWDACVEVFGDVANDAERGRRAKAVQLFKQALDSDGTAPAEAVGEFRARRDRYLAVFEHLPKPSAVALANHWTECKPLPQTLSTRRY